MNLQRGERGEALLKTLKVAISQSLPVDEATSYVDTYGFEVFFIFKDRPWIHLPSGALGVKDKMMTNGTLASTVS